MTATVWDACVTCGRAIIESGHRHTIEAAWDKDSLHPSTSSLTDLAATPRFLTSVATVSDRLIRYCARGKLPIPEELNHLRDDLWEFKGGNLRLAFYDAGERCGRQTLRATHVFVKRGRRTPLKEIDRGLAIARIDSAIP